MLPGTAMVIWKRVRVWVECVDYEVILSGIVGLLKKPPSHQTLRCVEPKQSSREVTDKVERFDKSAIQPKMVVPLV